MIRKFPQVCGVLCRLATILAEAFADAQGNSLSLYPSEVAKKAQVSPFVAALLLSTAPRGTLIGLAGIVGFHRAAIIIWFESPVVVDSERLSRALRDLERSVSFIGQILNRPPDEFLNDDEAVYAITP